MSRASQTNLLLLMTNLSKLKSMLERGRGLVSHSCAVTSSRQLAGHDLNGPCSAHNSSQEGSVPLSCQNPSMPILTDICLLFGHQANGKMSLFKLPGVTQMSHIQTDERRSPFCPPPSFDPLPSNTRAHQRSTCCRMQQLYSAALSCRN